MVSRGRRHRVTCHSCGRRQDVGRDVQRWEFCQPPGAETVVVFVCNKKCESTMYEGARFLNFFLGNDPVAYECNTVVRLDKLVEYGGLTFEDGKIVYVKKGGGPAPD